MRAVRTLGGGVVTTLLVASSLSAPPAAAQVVGPPEISSVSSSGVSERRAALAATIEPRGSATLYEVFVRYSPCGGGAGECPTPPRQERIGHGRVSPKLNARTVRAKLVMMTPGCTYAYWFVASNASGSVESEHQSVTALGGGHGPRTCKR
jgi:hypothetical protein